MSWLPIVLVGIGLFVLADVVLWFLPCYQRWLQRVEAEERELRLWAEDQYQAAQELLAWNAACITRQQKPRSRVYPTVRRIES